MKEPFDPGEFTLRLLEIYNAPKATVTKLRSGTQDKGEQAGDVLWSRKLYFRAAADGQAALTSMLSRMPKPQSRRSPVSSLRRMGARSRLMTSMTIAIYLASRSPQSRTSNASRSTGAQSI